MAETLLTQDRVFADKCRRLHSYLGSTKALLAEMGEYNRTRWPMHYPLGRVGQLRRANSMVLGSSGGDGESPLALRRTLTSEYDDETEQTDSDGGDGSCELSVLRLDVRLSHHGGSDVMGSLEESSIARLLEERLAQCEAHISKLMARVADRSSKILVTGDLNAGKSALVNALVRRGALLPSDQQPCTMLFCEVLDAARNDGIEEAHGIPDVDRYDRNDPATFVRVSAEDIEDVVMENDAGFQQLKVYAHSEDSLVHNGVVDVALIDSPGLNRDSLKTTQLYARQEEIDVVVFVVNAENHFTLSGQDFLLSAGDEKARIFIVVNRFDAIRRRERCERMILEQIRELSPLTYAERADLVHFVSAHEQNAGGSPDFARMEQCLRAFTLEQRFKSKLAPAQRYTAGVLRDVAGLAAENVRVATRRIQDINTALRHGLPRYETLLQERSSAARRADQVLDGCCGEVRRHTTDHLATTTRHLQDAADKVDCPGLLALWAHAEAVLLALVAHLEHEVAECGRFASFSIQHARTELSTLDARRVELSDDQSDGDQSPADQSGDALSLADSSIIAPIAGISNALDTVQLELGDFIDLHPARSWGVLTSASASAALSMLAARPVATHALSLLRLSSAIGAKAARRLLLGAAAVAAAGTLFYAAHGADAAVRRNLSARVARLLDDEGFVAMHADRLASETARAVRPFAWHLQHSFQRMVEAEELRRADHLRRRHHAQDSQLYFDQLRAKASDLAAAVRAVSPDSV